MCQNSLCPTEPFCLQIPSLMRCQWAAAQVLPSEHCGTDTCCLVHLLCTSKWNKFSPVWRFHWQRICYHDFCTAEAFWSPLWSEIAPQSNWAHPSYWNLPVFSPHQPNIKCDWVLPGLYCSLLLLCSVFSNFPPLAAKLLKPAGYAGLQIACLLFCQSTFPG